MSITNPRILGIIPARGGSKRLPNKNVKILVNKPLIAWTIEQTNKSKLLTKTIISTDDDEIARVAKQYGGVVPFMRPPHLAEDTSSSYDVIYHALDHFEAQGEKFEFVALFEPTSPLRNENDIDNAIDLMLKHQDKADSLISVGKIHLENPKYAKVVKDDYLSPFCANAAESSDTGQSDTYFPYGVIYLSKVSALRKYNTFYQPTSIPYYIERWQNYEVDDIFDFHCIEAVIKFRGMQ